MILDTSYSQPNLQANITDYAYKAKNEQIAKLVLMLGVDANKLKALMRVDIKELNINEYGRFDELKDTVDRNRAKVYFERIEGKALPAFRISIKIDQFLKDFILKDGGYSVDADPCNAHTDPSKMGLGSSS